MPVSYEEFAQKLSNSGLMTLEELQEFEASQLSSSASIGVEDLAQQLVRRYKLTAFQADVLQQTRPDPFVVGDFFIMDKIGQGGMGVVYKARPRDAYKLVALKMMTPRTADDVLLVKRFQREVDLASRLKHQNIVSALDGGEHEGRKFLVMELVDGHIHAAKEAGVDRIIHISITNPSEDSPLEYFSGKAQLERTLKESGVSYAIMRPTVLFGKEDILVNNIAWALRYLPVFGVFGDGQYKLQPIYVDDLAQLAVEQAESRENRIINAIGPETFTYRGLVQTIGRIIGRQRPIVSVPPSVGYLAGWVIGKAVSDVIITREEIRGLMDGMLFVDARPSGRTGLTEWAAKHSETLGRRYTSELDRRLDRSSEYRSN